MKRTEYKYYVQYPNSEHERTIYIDDNNNYVYKWDNRILEVYDHEYNRVNIPIEKMTRGMLNEYSKSLLKSSKSFYMHYKKEQHINREYRNFINIFIPKEKQIALDKLDEKLENYSPENIKFSDEEKLEKV